MNPIPGLARNSAFTRPNVLEGQNRGYPPPTPENSDALIQTARSGPNNRTVVVRSTYLFGVRVRHSISSLPVSEGSRSIGQASAQLDPFSSATEPLLPPQSDALLTSGEQTVRPRLFKNYCAQFEAWKNEDHPTHENRTEAVKRMMSLLKLQAPAAAILPTGGWVVGRGTVQARIRPSEFFSTLDLSSLGLSSLPPWLPPARKVNLDNNMLVSVPTNLITQMTDVRAGLVVKPEIILTNNPIPVRDINWLQSIVESSGYQGPQLIFSRSDQGYEPPRQLPKID